MTRARGKMWKRVGTARRFAWAGTDARHPVAGERRTKGNGGAARSAAVGKPRGKPPQTSPTGSIASAALQNPAESRLGRALRRASSRRPCKTPQKAASDEPIGKHRLGDPAKSRGRPPQTSPSGSIAAAALENPVESRLGRAPREAPPRRHWKNPRGKPASDEPLSDLGKARRKPPRTSPSGSIASAALQKPVEGRLGRAQREASPRRPCKTPWKPASDEPNGKHRLGGPAKARGSPPRTSPTGSIASAALQNPVEGRLRRALRRASPRRPWKSPQCSRPQRGCSRGRSPPRRRRWRRGC